MVFAYAYKYFVALVNVCRSPAECNQVQTFGGISCKDYLFCVVCTDKFLYTFTGVLVDLCCFYAKLVKPSQRVGVLLDVILRQGVYDPFGFLLGCRIIKVNKIFVFIKNREVFFA